MSSPLILNATEMVTPGHLAFGLWRLGEPDRPGYTDLAYWTRLGRTLEEGGFDALFLADALGQLDSYRESADPSLVDAVQTPLDDPLLLISAIAAATTTLGFGVTVSTSYEHPYLLARKFTTLDHLTAGRIGWNIVTSQLDSAARNLGRERQIPHDERYEIAQEFVEVAYKLWEGSWEDGAAVRDRERGVYADPRRVHAIGHRGRYFSVPSAHLSEPSVQRTPVIFQAGTSPRGRAFAARNAEIVFVSGFSPATLRRNVDAIRAEARAVGRHPDSIKFVANAVIVTADSDAAAEAKLRDYRRFYSVEGSLTHFSAVTGIDWSRYDLDAPLSYIETDSNRSFLAGLTKDAPPGEEWTLRKLIAGRHGISYVNSIVGGGTSVADRLEEIAEHAGLDGFNLSGAHPDDGYEDIAEHVVPVLRARGRIQDRRPGQTLRSRLFGSDHLAPDHPGHAFRHAFDDRPSSAPTLLTTPGTG
jgi:long-chain alkane monooxygenase